MIAMRSGSKGVKNKNIRTLGDVPLFAHAARAVLGSKVFRNGSQLIVNTDSKKYAAVARKYGAATPFLRPKRMAYDGSPIAEAIDHAYKYFRRRNRRFDLFALIQATSPFTSSGDIDRAVEILQRNPAVTSVISVTEVDVPPLWCNTLDRSLSMRDFIPKAIRRKNRQELPQYYRITGAIRIARWTEFQASGYDWYFENSKALIIDRERSLDIDDEEDFSYAEFLLKRRKFAEEGKPRQAKRVIRV
jgi:CMP-N,N'-diacetyllegionaminic acid synthase